MAASRAPRNTLTRDRLIDGALDVITERGLSGFTVRALAEHLGVRPMAIYHYTRSKEELLDALVDVLFGEVYLPSPGTDWRAELELRSRSMRDRLRERSWALAVVESRRHPGPATLAGHEAVLAVLRTAGFPLDAAAHAYLVLDAFVYGFVLQELMLQDAGVSTEPAAVARDMGLTDYPRVAEMARYYSDVPAPSMDTSFELGLGFVLDGVAALRGSSDADETRTP